MIKVNSLSGGRTSSFLAVKYPADYDVFSVVCIDDKSAAPNDPSLIAYVNEKLQKYAPEFGEFIATAEDDRTLVVMRDLEQFIGREITWVRGQSFDQVIDGRGHTRLPSWARRYCTEQMKLLPIFLWWFNAIGEKCDMRIGFRFDEFKRMERFFNFSHPTTFRVPIACKTYGERRQIKEDFLWRYCSFPLVEAGVTSDQVNGYWNEHGWIGGDLFKQRRRIEFPSVLNCVGCFHKSPEVLAAMAEVNPFKIGWFARQENKGMGTWLDSKVTYQHLIDNRHDIAKEVMYEVAHLNETCDTGGCTA